MTATRSYRISELIGRGSFGSVYLADTVGTGIRRPVAIKVLRPDQAAVPGLLERLRDEARMLAMIRHRAIVRVDDLVELDGHWSVVMEYIEGCDVHALLGEGPFPPRVAIAIAEEVANALHVAATQEGPDGRPLRLIHRDIKPGNIRVTAQGEVKLLDFGVARADFASREAGETNAVYGTPIYMAPERFRGEDSHAGDVYALGVTLFEMLAGEPPGLSAMEPDRVYPGIKLAPAWRQIRELSLPLRDLLSAMMARDPSDRPPARECARAMARIRGQMGGMVLEDWAERVVPPALRSREPRPDRRVGTVMVERPSQATMRTGRKAPGSVALVAAGGVSVLGIGAVVLALAGVGGWWWWAHRTAPVVVSAEPPVTVAAGTRGVSSGTVGTVETPTNPGTTVPAPPVGAATTEPLAAPPAGEPASGTTTAGTGPTGDAAATPATPATAATSTPTAASASAPTTSSAPATPPTASATASKTPTTSSTTPTSTPSTVTTTGPSSTARTAPTSTTPRTTSTSPSTTSTRRGNVDGGRGPAATGIVALEGTAESVMLMGRPGVFGAGEVPIGEYTGEVMLANGEAATLNSVTVNPARVTRVKCDAHTCKEIEEF